MPPVWSYKPAPWRLNLTLPTPNHLQLFAEHSTEIGSQLSAPLSGPILAVSTPQGWPRATLSATAPTSSLTSPLAPQSDTAYSNPTFSCSLTLTYLQLFAEHSASVEIRDTGVPPCLVPNWLIDASWLASKTWPPPLSITIPAPLALQSTLPTPTYLQLLSALCLSCYLPCASAVIRPVPQLIVVCCSVPHPVSWCGHRTL